VIAGDGALHGSVKGKSGFPEVVGVEEEVETAFSEDFGQGMSLCQFLESAMGRSERWRFASFRKRRERMGQPGFMVARNAGNRLVGHPPYMVRGPVLRSVWDGGFML
jgi:hypothetical protein